MAGAAARELVRDDDEPRGGAAFASEFTDQVDDLPLEQARYGDVERVHEAHPPLLIDTPITVVQSVNRRVVLVVAADRLHQHPAGRQCDPAVDPDRVITDEEAPCSPVIKRYHIEMGIILSIGSGSESRAREGTAVPACGFATQIPKPTS